ncbi:MAG: altronate oxidoreductase, partial [Bacteroidota bacterium]
MNTPMLSKDLQPSASWNTHPVKVVQFGTGALLRGLVDYALLKANQRGGFSGRVVAVGSTGSGRTQLMKKQDHLFTHRIEGVKEGE